MPMDAIAAEHKEPRRRWLASRCIEHRHPHRYRCMPVVWDGQLQPFAEHERACLPFRWRQHQQHKELLAAPGNRPQLSQGCRSTKNAGIHSERIARCVLHRQQHRRGQPLCQSQLAHF